MSIFVTKYKTKNLAYAAVVFLVSLLALLTLSPITAYGHGTDLPQTRLQTQNPTLKPGWNHVGNTWYYGLGDGSAKLGWLYDKSYSAWFYLDPNQQGAMLTGMFVASDGHTYYANGSGALLQSQWIWYNNQWYWANSGGDLRSGWLWYKNQWYYLNPADKAMLVGFFIATDGREYYALSDGHIYMGGWHYFGSRWYWMNSGGDIAYGLREIKGETYYLDPANHGAMVTGVFTVEGEERYFTSSGAMIKGLTKTPEGYRLVDSEGVLAAPGWTTVDGKRFFVSESGIAVAYTKEVSGKLYLYTPDGKVLSGWAQLDRSYYAASNGELKTGWVRPDSYWYYLRSGAVQTSEWIPSSGKWYYLLADGKMATGWIDLASGRYYLDPKQDGAMVSGSVYIDGVLHTFNSSGAWVREEPKPVVDLSIWQNPANINYDQLAQSISGAILRIGYTGQSTGNTYYKDPYFETHYRELVARGIPVGIYWYSAANSGTEGQAEAKKAIEYLAGRKIAFPIYMDVEDPYHQASASKTTLDAQVSQFATEVRKYGYQPGLYSSASWFQTKFDMKVLASLNLQYWVAHWGVSQPSFNGTWALWQYTSEGRLPGYNYNLDLNRTGY